MSELERDPGDCDLKELFFKGNEEYKLYEKGEWIVEGIRRFKTNIFQDKDGAFWGMNCIVSGSYPYCHYDFEKKLYRVKKKEKTIIYWGQV